MKRLGPSVLIAAIVYSGSASAQAVPSGLVLRWDAPPSCPSAADVEAAVAHLLGRPLAVGSAPFVAHAQVELRRHRGWRLRLFIGTEGRPRMRSLNGATCASVTEAAALVLALAIDPDAVASHPLALPAEEPPPPPPPPPPTPPPPPPPLAVLLRVAPPAPRPPVARRAHWNIRASIFADLGSLPQATLGPSLALGLSIGAWRLEVEANYALAQRTVGSSRGGEFDLFFGGVVACRLVHLAVMEIGGCGGFELGSLRGLAFGVSQPTTGSGVWLGARFGAMLRVPLGTRWGLAAELGGAVPLLRPRFVIENVGPVFQTDPIALRGAAGVEVYY